VGDRPVHGSLLIETRPAGPGDAEAVLEVILARDLADVGEPDFTLDDLRDEWADPEVDLTRDSLVVDAGAGLAAYALCTPHAQDVYVRPDHCGRGIGTALLPLVEARALARGLPRRQHVADRNAEAADLLAGNGYVVTHRYWRMVCGLDRDLEAARYPEGAVLRPFRLGVDDREVHTLVEAAFSEIEGNIAYQFDPWRVRSIESSSFDPAWWFIAVAGDRIVGVSLSEVWESDGIGWVGQLAVAPDWRGRGLGRALLLTSMRAFRERGLPRAALSVHGDNLLATRLYESAGMRPAWRHDRFEKSPN
jgi:mycothiol synthase